MSEPTKTDVKADVKADAQTDAQVGARALKNRILLILLLSSFVLPFVIGDLAYKHNWYSGGKTNRGQLITPPVAVSALALRDSQGKALSADVTKAKWWLVYAMPSQCESACRNRLFQMRQTTVALGKEADRVRRLLVLTAPLSAETTALLAREFPGFIQVQANTLAVDKAFARVTKNASSAGNLYVMDPMGWMMLFYTAEADEKTSIIKAEDILMDLKKLLKDSRIG